MQSYLIKMILTFISNITEGSFENHWWQTLTLTVWTDSQERKPQGQANLGISPSFSLVSFSKPLNLSEPMPLSANCDGELREENVLCIQRTQHRPGTEKVVKLCYHLLILRSFWMLHVEWRCENSRLRGRWVNKDSMLLSSIPGEVGYGEDQNLTVSRMF